LLYDSEEEEEMERKLFIKPVKIPSPVAER
jgi:hypothetical protein